jgi:hypothetical protein
MILAWCLAIVYCVTVLYALVWACGNHEPFSAATAFQPTFVRSNKMTNTYQLPWTQSTSDFANSQDVVISVEGQPEQTIATGLLMNVSSFVYDFLENAHIVYWIRTHHQNGTDVLDSNKVSFQAINKAPLVPAIAGTPVFVKHNP